MEWDHLDPFLLKSIFSDLNGHLHNCHNCLFYPEILHFHCINPKHPSYILMPDETLNFYFYFVMFTYI